MDNRPIGIFDSGLGGLTAFSALRDALPGENIIYFGDTGRCPYGTRPADQLRRMALQNLEFLGSFGCKAIIAACGTMSAQCGDILSGFGVPVFNVLSPAVEEISRIKGEGPLCVIATEASIRSGAFQKEIGKRCGKREVIGIPCQNFVSLCEEGHVDPDDELLRYWVRAYLGPAKERHADAMILGCTHFGIISEAISDYLGEGTRIISASETAVRSLVRFLEPDGLAEGAGKALFYTSGDASCFNAMAERILGRSAKVSSRHVAPKEV